MQGKVNYTSYILLQYYQEITERCQIHTEVENL